MTERITARQFHDAVGVEDWRVVGDGAGAYFRTGSLAAGARLAEVIGGLAGPDQHHIDIDLRQDGVTVRLFTLTPAPDGLGPRDIELAGQISAAARELGMSADPASVQSVHLSIDAIAGPAIMPFWRAVLGYADRVDSPDELNDPRNRWPTAAPAGAVASLLC